MKATDIAAHIRRKLSLCMGINNRQVSVRTSFDGVDHTVDVIEKVDGLCSDKIKALVDEFPDRKPVQYDDMSGDSVQGGRVHVLFYSKAWQRKYADSHIARTETRK